MILYNGVELPNICYGTGILDWYRDIDERSYMQLRYYTRNLIKDRKQLARDVLGKRAIRDAFSAGCKLFDTARGYGGAEFNLGKELKKHKRENIRIITKLKNPDQYKKDIKGAFEKSLIELGVEYIDVYLMHWPVDDIYVSNWKEMEKIYEAGYCKAIGVCNFNINHLEKLKIFSNIKPMINQIECHPLFSQYELRKYCQNESIINMAYTSTARMDERLYKTCLVEITQKYEKTVAQVILKWHQQNGNIPIFNSTNRKHIYDNIKIGDWVLEDSEIQEIDRININSRLRYDPANCDFRKL